MIQTTAWVLIAGTVLFAIDMWCGVEYEWIKAATRLGMVGLIVWLIVQSEDMPRENSDEHD